jgi:ABC-type sugar transport system substrate-binding protein
VAPSRVLLCLVDESNEFQRLLRQDAREVAAGGGLHLDVAFTGDFPQQVERIRAAIAGEPRPSAVVVLPVRDVGLYRMAKEAALAGIHWIFLTRTDDDVDGLRRVAPALTVTQICPDDEAAGRLQAEQTRALAPAEGRVLYVRGWSRSHTARDRSAGMEGGLAGTSLRLTTIDAGWTADEGYLAVSGWLRIARLANRRLDVLVCQNDMLAEGGRRALQEASDERKEPELARIPVLGCDGTPAVGQTMVRERKLAGTVILPRATGPAIHQVIRALQGAPPPGPLVKLAPTPLPSAHELATLAGRAAGA